MSRDQSEDDLSELAALAEPMLEPARAQFFREHPDGSLLNIGAMMSGAPSPSARRFVAVCRLLSASRFLSPAADANADVPSNVDHYIDHHLDINGVAALAWVWTEMSPRERLLARSMDPEMLVQWMAGSFSRLNEWMSVARMTALEGDAAARRWGDAGATIRRASRAKTLAVLLEGKVNWTASVQSMAATAHALWSRGCAVERQMAQAAKSAAFKTGQRWRAGAAIAGGLGLLSSAALVYAISPAPSVAVAAASGFGSLCVDLAMLAKSPSKFGHQEVKSKAWGPGTMKILTLIYPELACQGVFEAWRKFDPKSYDLKPIYEGYELAGCGPSDGLWAVTSSGLLGGPSGPGFKAWLEMRSLALAAQAGPSGRKKTQARL